MSLYSNVESGTSSWKSAFPIKDRRFGDIGYGRLYPIYTKFVMPGDIWKISTETFIRYQPLVAPPFTNATCRIREFFVPLRLVEPNTELIITGSQDGHYKPDVEIPSFPGLFDFASTAGCTVRKGGLIDVLHQMPTGKDFSSIKNEASVPAAYFAKAYYRCWWDFYRDENLNDDFDDFDTFLVSVMNTIGQNLCASVNLRKDYLTSALPWQLKGVAPRISPTLVANFSTSNFTSEAWPGSPIVNVVGDYNGEAKFHDAAMSQTRIDAFNQLMTSGLSAGLGFDAAEFRAMMAQTRIFERLARCGSRYTEYLRANFGTSPADGTLQRAQFIGGVRIPIVTTEVVQTAQDGSNPVGTLRGHGITHSGDKFPTFRANEFGVLFLLLDVMPQIQYTQGVDREYTYKRRFDFFNPSFQHLSEQEVRNGEVYFDNDGKNDETFGFQAYANELRSSSQKCFGEMRGTLAYWNQAITFPERPALNAEFIAASNYNSSFMKPFAVTNENPMVIDFGVFGKKVRPMVKYGTPGLVDHL